MLVANRFHIFQLTQELIDYHQINQDDLGKWCYYDCAYLSGFFTKKEELIEELEGLYL